jgi:polyhydroxybutyrate depolymerase
MSSKSLATLSKTKRIVTRHGWVLLALCVFGCSAKDQSGNTTSPSDQGGASGAGVPSTSSGVPSTSATTAGKAAVGLPSGGAPAQTSAAGVASGTSTAGSQAAGASGTGSSGSGVAPIAAGAGGATSGASGNGGSAGDAPVGAGECSARAGTAANAGFLGDWAPGTYPDDFRSADIGRYLTMKGLPNQANTDREYAVHVPAGYDKSTPLPALVCLHAFSMNARSFCDTMAGWLEKADKEKFVLIMPNGYMNSFNIGDGCGAEALPVHTDGVDDVAFIRALLDDVSKHVNVDPGRVYATGFSNGSSLAWRLACEASDIFTAVVPVAAGSCLSECKPTHKVSVLDVYGTADFFNPTEDTPASLAALRSIGGCSAETTPAMMPMDTGAGQCLTGKDCGSTECAPVEVTQCIVQNGSHCWFGDMSTADCGAGNAENKSFMTNIAWEFLSRFSR